MKRGTLLGLSLLAMLALVGCGTNEVVRDKIYLITMSKTDSYWDLLNSNAQKVYNESGRPAGNYKYESPSAGYGDSTAGAQNDLINSAVANGARVIMLAAYDAAASKRTVEEAIASGVDFIYVDSPSNATGYTQSLLTDNYEAGKDAGVAFKNRLMEEGVMSGKIGIMRPDTSASTDNRAKGFEAGLGRGYDTTTVIIAESKVETAQEQAETWIADGFVAIYGTNTTTSIGIGNAIKASSKTIYGAGFDVDPAILSHIKEGSMWFTMQQNPELMASEGMKSALLILDGSKDQVTPKDKDTGVNLVS